MTNKLALLTSAVYAGELLAARTAERQARIASAPWMRRALALQARQEHGHVKLAAMAAAIAGGGRPGAAPSPLYALDARLTRDLDRGDLGASIAGLHGVLEHLGEALLHQLGRHTHPAGAVLHRLRRHVLAQEQQHIALGARCLHDEDITVTPEVLAEYRELGRHAANGIATQLADARISADAFWSTVSARLDDWYHAHTA